MGNLRVGVDLISERGTPGGVHTYANRLLEALARSALEGGPAAALELVVFAHDDFQWLFPAESHPALRLVWSGRRGLGATVRRALQQALVPGLCRRERLDLLHSVNNVLPLRGRTPAVVTVHDLSPFALPERFGGLKRSFLRWAVPRSVRRARRVIAVSEATRRDILRWVRGAKADGIVVVAEAADTRFHPRRDPAAEESLSARYRLPAEFLLSVGAAEPGKNLAGVAAALEILRARSGLAPPWVIAGASGPSGRRLLESLRRLPVGPQILDLGVVRPEDLPHLYRMASLFLFPSLHEGFGLPLLEALACGAATITSNVSSLPEVAGRAALRVDPRRPEAIARAVERLWRRPRARAILSGRGPARAAGFSWEEAARRTLDVYREALSGG